VPQPIPRRRCALHRAGHRVRSPESCGRDQARPGGAGDAGGPHPPLLRGRWEVGGALLRHARRPPQYVPLVQQLHQPQQARIRAPGALRARRHRPRPHCLHRPRPTSIQLLCPRRAPPARHHVRQLQPVRRGQRLCQQAVGARMSFHTADVADPADELATYDVVFLTALVVTAAEDKAKVIAHLGEHMADVAAFVVRSAHGARGFLYPIVDPEDIGRGGF
uniref:Nicotianamine synthase n=1 Tax=Triticum urartu TaxID=4572 RepID=A0A8R7QLF0_TRIUA